MQTTLTGKGPRCRICTHPQRLEIESQLASGASIASIEPAMGATFSRRALSRHRAKHMMYFPSPAARPVPFPHSGSTLQKVKWLQREVEHTAALAEQREDPSTKLKALHELSRLIWLEARLGQGAIDVTPDPAVVAYEKFRARLDEADTQRQAALETFPPESPQIGEELKRALELSELSCRTRE